MPLATAHSAPAPTVQPAEAPLLPVVAGLICGKHAKMRRLLQRANKPNVGSSRRMEVLALPTRQVMSDNLTIDAMTDPFQSIGQATRTLRG